MKKIFFASFILTVFLSACSNNSPKEEIDTPTSGNIWVSVDETLKPIAIAEIDMFMHQYPKAKINIRYRSETECVQDLYKDSSKLIFVGRKLRDDEKKAFESIRYFPPEVKVATDAIVLLVNKANKDTAMTFEKAVNILRGGDTKYTLVFDKANSGTSTYVLDLIGSNTMPKNAYAAKSNEEAINFVAQNPNAMAIIGYSWVADSDDKMTRETLKKLRVIHLTPREKEATLEYYPPHQLYIAQKRYPFTRDVYLIQRENRAGLSAGLTSFVYGDIGQIIMLKAGLLPATQYDRWLEMKVKPIGDMFK